MIVRRARAQDGRFIRKTENRLYRIPEEHAFGELRGWDPSASVLVLPAVWCRIWHSPGVRSNCIAELLSMIAIDIYILRRRTASGEA